jgi:tetratricopeptide (TPR) repeat protein
MDQDGEMDVDTEAFDRLWGLWDFGQPAESEQRFRAELAGAEGEAALLVRTQLGRSLGLQGRFDECRAELDAVAEQAGAGVGDATPLVRAYERLERGRMHRSSGQPEQAAPHFLAALEVAQTAGLDHVAADAAHMMAIVGAGEEQITWAERALTIANASSQPRARRWVGSVENNLGWTLHDQGRFAEAQEHFERALQARLEQGDAEPIRIGRWTVARGLRSLGRLDEALQIQRDLHANGPEDGYVEEELSELLRALGRDEEAQAHADRAKELLGQG